LSAHESALLTLAATSSPTRHCSSCADAQIEYLDVGGAQRTDSGLWSLSLTDAGMQAIASVTELRELRLTARP